MDVWTGCEDFVQDGAKCGEERRIDVEEKFAYRWKNNGKKVCYEERKKHNGKLKIAMYGHKRIPSREDGIEVVAGEIAPRMVQLGHEVTCFNRMGHHVRGKEHNLEHLTSYQGVQLKNVFAINRKRIAAVTSSFFGALRAAFGNYNVVHIHAERPAAF